jgi:hypothetical protein
MTAASGDGRRIDYLCLDLCGTRFDEFSDFLLAVFLGILLFPQVFLYGVEEIIHLEGLDYVTVGAPIHRIINMVRLGFSKHSPEIPWLCRQQQLDS